MFKRKGAKDGGLTPTFCLAFRAEVLQGQSEEEVRAALVAALRLNDARAARLFSGKRVVVRRRVDEATAYRYVARFAEMGAHLRVEPEPPPTWKPEPGTEMLLDLDATGDRRAVLILLAGLGLVSLAVALGWARLAPRAPEAPSPTGPAVLVAKGASGQPSETSAGPALAVSQAQAQDEPDSAAADDPLRLLSVAARSAYVGRYKDARSHKAFAVSGSGARYAWVEGLPDADSARERALNRCVAQLEGGDSGCSILDADGELER